MRTTIDAAGRLVIPRVIREQVGVYGVTEVDIELDGAAIRIEPASAAGGLVEEDGRLVIPGTGTPVTTEMVDRMRDADRR
jgi:bifunctional DNA-binding transcriptional regulator/antitoxin component of YhaV-PrlF toxin-antitoxin module